MDDFLRAEEVEWRRDLLNAFASVEDVAASVCAVLAQVPDLRPSTNGLAEHSYPHGSSSTSARQNNGPM